MADVVFGFVHDFGSGEEWSAVRGGGARLDGAPLDAPLPKESIELLGLEATKTVLVAEHAPSLTAIAERLRVMGSLALSLCHLAAGRVDAVASLRPARSVDIAAAQLLVRERGSLSSCSTSHRSRPRRSTSCRARVSRPPPRPAACARLAAALALGLRFSHADEARRARRLLSSLSRSPAPPVGIKATLKAPAAEPKVNVKWPYSIKVTDLTGKGCPGDSDRCRHRPAGYRSPDGLRADGAAEPRASEADQELAVQGHLPRLHHLPAGRDVGDNSSAG